MDGMLSQEEINALLSGMDFGEDSSADDHLFNDNSDNDLLTEEEKDAIGEISNISMGTAATTLFSLVNQKVNITTPVVSYAVWDDLMSQYDRPCVFLQISYKEGLDGSNVLVLKERDVMIIADLMMGGDGSNTAEELGELQISAICEAMNQMMGSASTSLSSMLNCKIDICPPIANLVDFNTIVNQEDIATFLTQKFVRISFKMTIGNLVDSEIMQLFPIEFAKSLYSKFTGTLGTGGQAVQEEPKPQNTVTEVPPVQQSQAPAYDIPPMQGMPSMQGMPAMQNGQPVGYQTMPPYQGGPAQGMPYPGVPYQGMPYQPNMGMPYGQGMSIMPEINVQPAQFQSFSNNVSSIAQKENINLIMDVPLEVTVELGRTSKSIQDILEFAPGTIIELDKIAGEPIDVLVNGKYVAKGEVVVIEESFGIRVTEIIK